MLYAVLTLRTFGRTCVIQEMLEKIKETAAEKVCGEQPQCYVLFTLSHGGVVDNKESVFGTDGKPVSKKLIRDALSGTNCPNLNGVLRLVFFQCCRGGMVEALLFLPRDAMRKHGICCPGVCLSVRPSISFCHVGSSSSSSSRFIERITQTHLMRYVSRCAANRRVF